MSDDPRGPDRPLPAGLLGAHEAFYAAIESGDLDRLRAVWSADADVVCSHPGAPPIHGLAAVMRSWALILANTGYIQFFLTDVEVSVVGDVAAVTCTENMLAAGDEVAGPLNGGRARALNVFTSTPDGWRLWIHQATPVVSEDL